MKVLLFGSSGMAGHVISDWLSWNKNFQIINTSFLHAKKDSINIDVRNIDQLKNLIYKTEPDIIINCIGVLIKGAIQSPANAIFLNAYFPHLLHEVCIDMNTKIIHLSTDCVFSGKKGNYSIEDEKDARDIYGMSKSLGELNNTKDLTIRTSIIGPELKENGEGLLHWFLTQKGTIKGYKKTIWSGITTLQLAKIIEYAIFDNLTGIIQPTNGEAISKYELLKIFKSSFNKNDIIIEAVDGKNINKSLIASPAFSKIIIPSYKGMCHELFTYMKTRKMIYSMYDIF